MTTQINQIVEHLFHKPRLDDVSVYELERFIATHPYFAAGHLLLAKKTQQSNPAQTREKVATTLLYYNNPLWLQWLLDHDITTQTQKTEAKETTSIPANGPDTAIEDHSSILEDDSPRGELVLEDEERVEDNSKTFLSSPAAEEPSMPVEENDDRITPAVQSDFELASNDELVADAPVVEEPQEFLQPKTLVEESIEETNQPAAEPLVTAGEDRFEPQFEHAQKEQAQPLDETMEKERSDGSSKESTAEPGMEREPAEPTADEAESRATVASIGTRLSRAALIPTRAEMEKGDFTFEPYHTIDYFASQGIKLQQSDLSRDKFGKQLKSFTEWLKSMKRLPQAVAEGAMDDATQQSIQRIAEHSFEEKDIVTETMAEVWIKQGNKQKAIDTLQKLSLLNPSKSHYFAAKIEQLKAS